MEEREREKRVRAMTVEIGLRVARRVTSQFSLSSEGEKKDQQKKERKTK